MPTNHNQTWDRDGNLIHEEYVEVPDMPPTPEQRIAALESDNAHLRETLDAAAKAGSFEAMKQAVTAKLIERESPPVKGADGGDGKLDRLT
jgi:hypothetical protein